MTKDQLRAYRDLKLEFDQVSEQLQAMEATIYSPTSPRLDGMPHSSSSKGSAVERAADSHIALQNKYKAKKAELESQLLEIEDAIDALPSRERTLCRYYYEQGLTWEQVCVRMNYSWSQIHRIHAKALILLNT